MVRRGLHPGLLHAAAERGEVDRSAHRVRELAVRILRRPTTPHRRVDEPLYRRLPAFLVVTVDKFASLPWVGDSGALLGGTDRYDVAGFHGAATPHRGSLLARPLPPPDLVIQDELHLIFGPLGTMAGLYETVIESLCTREIDGRRGSARYASSLHEAEDRRLDCHRPPRPGVDSGALRAAP